MSSAKQEHFEHLKKVLLLCFPVAPEHRLTLSSIANTPFPGVLLKWTRHFRKISDLGLGQQLTVHPKW